MKILHEVSTREVVRSLLIAGTIRDPKKARKFLGRISPKELQIRLGKAKKNILKLNPAELDKKFVELEPWRRPFYHDARWYLAEVTPKEMGVWRRAGGLPLAYTKRSLRETADQVRHALQEGKSLAGRSQKAIRGILATSVKELQKEKYLYPILFKGGTGTLGRRYLKYKTAFDIDDGCMRSIALAVHGAKSIRAYIGFPEKMRK